MTASSGLLLFSCRATPLALARHAQLGTARAGVPLDFLRAGQQRLAGDKVEYRLLSAHAHRDVRRAGASVREIREHVLHDAVFQRVVADHRDVEVDASGRIMLSPEVRAAVGIDKEVVVVGNTGRFEIWDADRFKAMSDEVDLGLFYS